MIKAWEEDVIGAAKPKSDIVKSDIVSVLPIHYELAVTNIP